MSEKEGGNSSALSESDPVLRFSADLQSLRAEVEKLKLKSNMKKDPMSSLAILGGLLGLLTAVIAFPRTVRETKDYWFASPATKIIANGFAVEYAPGDNTYSVRVPLLLQNDGSGNDVIRESQARIIHYRNSVNAPPDDNHSDGFLADDNQFNFYSKGSVDDAPSDMVNKPVAINKGAGLNVICSILFDKGTFTEAGYNELTVELTSLNGSKENRTFCFYFDSQDIKDLQNGLKGRKNFAYPSPTCGA